MDQATLQGGYNTFIGQGSGIHNKTGSFNTYIGKNSGLSNSTGKHNTYLGGNSGLYNETGSNNVMIGYESGHSETGSHKLHIANNRYKTLIYGEFDNNLVQINGNLIIKDGTQRNGYVLTSDTQGKASWKPATGSSTSQDSDWVISGENMSSGVTGKVGIGTTAFPSTVGSTNLSSYKLFVKGGILAEEVRVNTTWADYVFDNNYQLNSLKYVENYIKNNGHLSNVPSAKEIENQGVEIGNITRIQQEKIEELTLYLIQQEKKIEKLENMVNDFISKQ